MDAVSDANHGMEDIVKLGRLVSDYNRYRGEIDRLYLNHTI